MNYAGDIPAVAVVGLGNVLLGDDGIGCLAVQSLAAEYEFGPEVEIIDLGAPGLDLAPYFYGRDLVVIVDAVNAEGEPGAVRTYSESELAGSAQLRVSDHDPGLHEALAQLRLVDRAPQDLIIFGVIPESCAVGADISSTVQAAGSVAVNGIVEMLRERGFNCRTRPSAADKPLKHRGNGANGGTFTADLRG